MKTKMKLLSFGFIVMLQYATMHVKKQFSSIRYPVYLKMMREIVERRKKEETKKIKCEIGSSGSEFPS